MPETSPADPADHAEDFAVRWAERLDEYCAIPMSELGIPPSRIGSSDHNHGIAWSAFNPQERDGDGISPSGQINVDAGILNPEQMSILPSPTPEAWRSARLRDRIDAAIAHEDMEWSAGSHEAAVELAPETDLPIGERVRSLLRAIRSGEQAIRGGGPNPPR